MSDLHPLLVRQLRRIGVVDASHPPDGARWAELLGRVSRAYSDADSDRYTLERSLEISSREMTGLYEQLRASSESSLAEEKERLLAVMTAIGDGLVVFDAAGAAQYVNPAARALLGLGSPAVPEGVLLSRIEAAGGGGERLDLAARESRAARSDDKRFVRADGGEFTAACVLAPITSSGVHRGSVLVFRDVTASKRLMAELEAARVAAEAASRAKSEFLAVMSHEIRTPMNGVIGMSELLAASTLASDQRECVETVLRSGRALLEILNDILDFSKIEAGRIELEELEFDPRRHAEETLELVADRAQAKGLELVPEFDRGLPASVLGDPGRVRQVALNLLSNAVKFTAGGSIRLRVACDRAADGRPLLRYEVVDSGIGIDPEAQNRLFRPFMQADSSTTRRFGGTGLGLAISLRLAEAMGGAIGVRSSPGTGSAFWFTIAARGVVPAPSVAARDGMVVVASSRPQTRASLAERISALGWRVATAADEEAALAAVGGRPGPRCVVVDGSADLAWAARLCRRIAASVPAGDAVPGLHVVAVHNASRETGPLAGIAIASLMSAPARTEALSRLFAAPETAPPPVSPARFDGSSRVLLVEDNPINQLVAKRLLARLGVTPQIAENGRLAVEAVSERRYDLVLMDCQMAELDGFEASRAIRRMAAPAGRVPIVAMTANALQGDRERCLAAGMNDYLTKPIELAVLQRVIAPWLRAAAPVPC